MHVLVQPSLFATLPSSQPSLPAMMPLPHAEVLQLLSQPSPLTELPSSHCSPPATTPFPQPLTLQLLSQPSPLTELPSSHDSLPAMIPSPHAMQTPAVQAPVAAPEVHTEPFGFAGFEQTPVPLSQVPAVWQLSGFGQVTVLDAAQTPFWQLSPEVQALLSVHAVPLAAAG